MDVEVKPESTQMTEVAVSQEKEPSKDAKDIGITTEHVKVAQENSESKKENEPKTGEAMVEKKTDGDSGQTSFTSVIERHGTFKEESSLISDLKEYEKNALLELTSMLEDAIHRNKLFNEQKEENNIENAPLGEEKEKQSQEEEEEEEEKSTIKEAEESEKTDVIIEEKRVEINKDISLWGVPLMPNKGNNKGTDVLLLKFLRAREFKVSEAFEMLKNTLQWRKDFKIDDILDEDFGPPDFGLAAYMSGIDREGHPICYNVYGVFENDETYNKTFGSEESREKFLRWRFQLMEKGIRELDFKPGGVSSLLQINDLKNTPGPSRKELRLVTKRVVGLLQDNYPEFVARNIFINVPFWYYAFNALLSPFLTQRTKTKFVFARPSRVTETLLKYISPDEIPVQYGGLKRENDSEFSTEDGVVEATIKAGSTETIEIPAPEVGATLIWDLTVLGWEVSYKEEFVPTDEGSYTVIVKKERKIGWLQEGSVRNSFTNNEPGKVVLTVENGSFKKKRILYRYKTKNCSA